MKSLTVPSILIVGTSITGNLFAINVRGVKKKKKSKCFWSPSRGETVTQNFVLELI